MLMNGIYCIKSLHHTMSGWGVAERNTDLTIFRYKSFRDIETKLFQV